MRYYDLDIIVPFCVCALCVLCLPVSWYVIASNYHGATIWNIVHVMLSPVFSGIGYVKTIDLIEHVKKDRRR